MDSSRRAVDAYWRSRMIDGVTSDEDKVAPVYKLEEICELLRSSDAGIVKEVADYIFKRIDHKSPVVKQKALRLIKYAVVKSGVEFRREMQRHSSVIRELFHYRGHPDPLKGDALNKAVRETAHEAISSIFTTDDNKMPPTEGIGNRIEGFGNKNYEMRVEDKKSFLSEVVDIGRASIEQGLSSIASAHLSRKSDNGNYRSPNLRRSLTNERDIRDRYEGNSNKETWVSPGISKETTSGAWRNDSTESVTIVATNGDAGQSHSGSKSREERLLETIVTSGGVRLQPTRDAIQIFLSEASKLNQLSMCHAIESKLQSNLWQVRMKAICVLESTLRKKNDEQFSIISSYFSENRDHILKCSDSPQVSLREKANKVISLLEGENTSGTNSHPGESSTGKNAPKPAVPLPDLIDTGFSDGSQNESLQNQTHQNPTELMSTSSLVDDLFGNEPSCGAGPGLSKNESDPFADVSFHTSEDGKHVDDLFSGLTIDERKPSDEINKVTSNHTSDLLDIFGSEPEPLSAKTTTGKVGMHDFMADLTTNGVAAVNKQPGGPSVEALFGATATFNKVHHHPTGNEFPSGVSSHQAMVGINPNVQLPLGSLQYNIPSNMMFNQNFATQPMSYGSMGNIIAQQQLLFQNLGSVDAGTPHGYSNVVDGSYSSPIPDIFHPSSNMAQQHSTMMSSSKKDETKAFDFISDHLSSARNPKRLI